MLDFTFLTKYKNAARTFGLLFLMSFPGYLMGQCAMACEDQINVGLDAASCEAIITYDMILKGQEDPMNCSPNAPSDFRIYLSRTEMGAPIPGSPVVTRDDFGDLFYATVTHIPSNTTCTGTLMVDDDAAPVIECPPDTLVDCGVPTDTAQLGTVQFNTCVDVSIRVSDFKENLVMSCAGLAERITRTFRVTAANGKSSSCLQTIEVERPAFNELTFPPNRNGTDAPTVSCDSIALGVEATGSPGFNDMPIDLKNGLCGYSATFRDRTLDDCGSTFTIVRTWTVVDPCSGTVERQDQIIVVADKQAPQINCPDTLRVSTTNANACTASVLLPTVDITDNCSANIAVAIQTPGDNLNSNGGLVHGLPEGTNEVTYFATDECGQVGSCQTIVVVSDGTAPALTCEDRITVSLTEGGSASFGTASTVLEAEDNCCSNVELDIRRMDEDTYAEQVTVTCADVGQTLLVLSRATDCNDNDNLCMVQVDVVDNSATTTIECPEDITVDCTVDYNDPMETGLPIIMGSCSTSSTQATFTDDLSDLNLCGIGSIVRTWTLNRQTEGDGTCVQNITVQDPTPLQVTFPQDLTLNDCVSPDDLEPFDLNPPFDRPVFSGDDDCNNVNTEFEDLDLIAEPGSCIVLRRVWTVTETCVFDPANPAAGGMFRDTQRIVINETEAPVITCQENITVSANSNCVANVFIPRPGISGECFPDAVNVSATGDLGNGLFHLNVAAGTYDMVIRVTDRCGNTSTCDVTIDVLDEVAPTANCQTQFTANIEADGTVLVTGAQLDDGSTDDCTAPGDLSFRIGPVPPPASTTPPQNVPLLFDCDDVGSLASVAMWVGDASGNWSFCTTNLQIGDPNGNCTRRAPAAMVAGVIQSPSGAMVDQVELRIAQEAAMPAVTTGESGAFSFDALALHENYRIVPQRYTAYNESLSTFDLVKLMQHLTGRQLITDPYLQIAADVNGDTRISIFDAITLQKLILNLETEVDNSPSWRFVPTNFNFLNPTDVFDNGFPEFVDINNLTADYMEADFTGIKVGDLNMSFRSSNAKVTQTRGAPLPVRIRDKTLEAGQRTELVFELAEWEKLGFQMALAFSPDLEVLALEAPGFGSGLQYSELRPGHLRISAIQPEVRLVKEEQLLKVTVRAKRKVRLSSSIRLATELMEAELITDGASIPKPLRLEFDQQAAKEGFDAWLSPNPMNQLSFLHLEQGGDDGPLRYQLWTASGQLLLSEKVSTGGGTIKIPIRKEQLNGSGIYFLQVIGQNSTKTLRLLNP
ncbi:MAG TPA: T9SS type A sorting domain-containing protein [Saprospiraceae bacterium]|nr:T9SS type A sorting domain-containing protein [Saprospiraceae bacterium]